ncbi:MAG: dTDP-4-amino-4,6-dideoxygalactose transaminase [Acidobacteriaceae bacterium]|nr:dTDP-4-amino-4,6-dideoxygalactose transaminase [Acidobacteriaceae bacterium]
MSSIPFNCVSTVGTEMQYIQRAFANLHICGDGLFTKRCHTLLETEVGTLKALLTTSCTHALEMAALLLNIKPGDEVIVPSFTFVSTVNAFVLRGAKPVFIDIRPDTLNLEENSLEALISPATKAILCVHYAGVGCEMDTILRVASRHGIPVIEDNAHGLFGRYRGKPLGSFGCLATQSFHETKNFSCGEGGAILINDPELIDRAEILREKGTNRSRFFRGQVDKYTWVDLGSSYLPSDILAAILFAQLEVRETIQAKRQLLWNRYFEGLMNWSSENDVILPTIPAHCEQTYHIFYLLFPTLELRQAMIQHLKQRNILSVFHYVPLHLSQMGLGFGGWPGQCPVTEEVSNRLLRLPLYSGLSDADQDRILEAIYEFDFLGTKPAFRTVSAVAS